MSCLNKTSLRQNYNSIIFFSILIFTLTINLQFVNAQSTGNLIKSGEFEDNIDSYFAIWKNANSQRTYDLYRSDVVFAGHGSFSAAIEAQGAPEDSTWALFTPNSNSNKVNLTQGKNYVFEYFAKSSVATKILFYSETTANYQATSPFYGANITEDWQRYSQVVTPTASGDSLIVFAIGNLPAGSTLNVDGIKLTELSNKLTTKEVKGYIGEKNKSLKISGFNPSDTDIDIELPYNDAETGQLIQKRFQPEKVDNSGVYFSMNEKTFSGIGRIYVNNILLGEFNYNVLPRITEIYPSQVRADADLTVNGSGFSPVDNNTFIIMNTIDTKGKRIDIWLKPKTIDSELKLVSLQIPIGVVSGRLYVNSSFTGLDSKTINNKSNSVNYKIKPSIYKLEWAKRGYDLVGDKIRIYGKGISNNPTVKFYDQSGKEISRLKAKLVSIGSVEETIESETPKNLSNPIVTVICDGVESDKSSALQYVARPRLTKISARTTHFVTGLNSHLPATKIGDVITLSGESLGMIGQTTTVEFQGIGQRIKTNASGTDKTGRTLKVTVPEGAISGLLNVESKGKRSNSLTLDIIPNIISVNPNPVIPGKPVSVTVKGMGGDINLTKIYFKISSGQEVSMKPDSILQSGNNMIVSAIAPNSLSYKNSTVNIEYNKLRNDEAKLTVAPSIERASIDMDNKTLIIQGNGFSNKISENVITYKYADEARTVVKPNVRVLGVYSNEEGQEIRIQILDDYHYGYVSVSVNGQNSNEVNFGPLSVRSIARRIEYVKSVNQVMGVLYISGSNFGPNGGVKVGDQWADVHYRSDFLIIAIVDKAYVYGKPVIVTKI
jgi:hypothetical protein